MLEFAARAVRSTALRHARKNRRRGRSVGLCYASTVYLPKALRLRFPLGCCQCAGDCRSHYWCSTVLALAKLPPRWMEPCHPRPLLKPSGQSRSCRQAVPAQQIAQARWLATGWQAFDQPCTRVHPQRWCQGSAEPPPSHVIGLAYCMPHPCSAAASLA